MNSWDICDGRGWVKRWKLHSENWGTEAKGSKSFFKDCNSGPSLSDANKPRGMAEEGWLLAHVSPYDAENPS